MKDKHLEELKAEIAASQRRTKLLAQRIAQAAHDHDEDLDAQAERFAEQIRDMTDQQAEEFLRSPESQNDGNVYFLLLSKRLSHQILGKICREYLNSPKKAVREIGISESTIHLRATKDPVASHALAMIVRDHQEPQSFRLSAYRSLVSINHRDADRGNALRRLRAFRDDFGKSPNDMLQNVNWGFVDSFL